MALGWLASGRSSAQRAAAPSHSHGRPAPLPPELRDQALPAVARFRKALRLPGAEGLFAALPAKAGISLTAEIRRHALFEGRTTDLMSYRASVAGRDAFNPLLRARTGDVADVTLANQLGEDTTIHWHGMMVDERNDGSGMHPVAHGASYHYRFPILNRAGLYWYHPHPHDRTGAQIHLGMAGVLLVDDAEDDALRRELGLAFGETELPLVIQDKQVDERNRIRHSMGEDDWIGNRMLVNWTPEPFHEALTCLHRLRILNASNARTYLLAFLHRGRKLPYTLIGTDGGLLDKPRNVTEVFLAPAQRIDVLVDFGGFRVGEAVTMASLRYDPMENDGAPAVDPAIEHPGAPPMGDPLEIMRFDMKVPVCATRRVPGRLSSLAPPPSPATATRRFRLHMDGPKWLINGYNFHDDMRAVRESVKRGAREVWEITNDMQSMPHPMHLHGFQFRVVQRRGSPPQVRRMAVTREGLMPADLGLQDTVLVWPAESVRIAIDFSQPFQGTQGYMFHCHNLEHEDQGMMLNFTVA